MTDRFDDDDDALAAEYVLGVLDLPERLAAEVRIAKDTAFAAQVTVWQNRLSDLNDDYAPVPAPDLMPQIEGRLFPQDAPKRRFGWAGWGLGAALAAGLALFAYLPQPADPALTAAIVADAGDLGFDAVYDASAETLTITRIKGTAAPDGKSHELWLIRGDAAPSPLGVFDGETLILPLPKPLAGDVLAISLEPAGGSPTGLPTGPVLAAGALTNI